MLAYANKKIEELDTRRQTISKAIAELSVTISPQQIKKLSISPQQIKKLSYYLDNWDSIDFDDKKKAADGLISIVYQRVLNMIKLYAKQRRLIHLVTRQIYEKERNNRMMIGILSQIVEFRNGESGLHVIHINLITQLLLEQLVKKTGKYQLSWEDRLLIATASALHDIGKIGIDEKILNKPGKLTKEEFEIMKTHTLIGAQMLDNLDMYRNEKLLKLAHEICRWHHERYDGKGYPDGLVGEEIPISAQVVSLADVYDALVSERVYKKAFSHEKALEMIQNGECGTFNPLLLQCMTEAQDKLKTMMEIAEKE